MNSDKSKSICYYISDHGWGHATRSIAIIRKICGQMPDVRVIVKNSNAYQFISKSLESIQNVKVINQQNDIGLLQKENSVNVDWGNTDNEVMHWIKSWDSYIKKETKFCDEENIDLIISDIAPQPFLVANELKIPSIAIANFTWYEMYRGNVNSEVINRLLNAYKSAKLHLALPFSNPEIPIENRINIGLVARDITKSKETIRRSLGINDEDKLIYLGLGRAVNLPNTIHNYLQINKRINFLLSSEHEKLGSNHIYSIPPNVTESQDYIAACDLSISKFGYSTTAEAITARVPMLLLKRRDLIEDREMLMELSKHRIYKEFKVGQFYNGSWLDMALEMLNDESFSQAYKKLPKRLTDDWSEHCISKIKEFL